MPLVVGGVYSRYNGVIGFADFSFAKEGTHTRECFAGATEYDDAACGAVESMGQSEEYFAWLVVFFFDVGFGGVEQGGVACFVALSDFAWLFADDEQVVVFEEDGHFLFLGKLCGCWWWEYN